MGPGFQAIKLGGKHPYMLNCLAGLPIFFKSILSPWKIAHGVKHGSLNSISNTHIKKSRNNSMQRREIEQLVSIAVLV